MKKLAICAGTLFLSLSIFAQAPQTYKGEIIDSQCAALGGHQVMAKQGESEKDCTNRCVTMGGRYTLYDPATKTFTLNYYYNSGAPRVIEETLVLN